MQKQALAGLMVSALVLTAVPGVTQAATAPTGLAAVVTTGDDTSIDLSWNPVANVDGYYVYRVGTPIQTQGTITGGSDGSGSWDNPSLAADGDYTTGALIQPYGSNDYIEITFTQPRTVGAVGYLQSRQPDRPNWVRNDVELKVDGNVIYSGNADNCSPGFCRNKYQPLYNPNRTSGGSVLGPPLDATTVRVTQQGGATDPGAGITEIDLWEFERVGSVGAGTTSFTDTGRTPGETCTYFVTSHDAGGQSNLSNLAALRAGDRDDTNSGDIVSDYQRGSFDGLPAKVQVPDAGSNFSTDEKKVLWDASPTEAATGDVKRYAIFRGVGAGSPQLIETAATLVSKRHMNGENLVLDGSTAGTGTNGNRAYSNYSESDDTLDFGDGNYYAMVRMAIHQQDGSPQQHCYRNVYVEADGGYTTDLINMTTINAWTTTRFATSGTVPAGDVEPSFATFGFVPKAEGDGWIVGDQVTLHLGNGENSVDFDEYQLWGIPIELLGYVDATGAAGYEFEDLTGDIGVEYSYFIVTEDYAGNQSLAMLGMGTLSEADIPEPATLALLGVGGVGLLIRRRR